MEAPNESLLSSADISRALTSEKQDNGAHLEEPRDSTNQTPIYGDDAEKGKHEEEDSAPEGDEGASLPQPKASAAGDLAIVDDLFVDDSDKEDGDEDENRLVGDKSKRFNTHGLTPNRSSFFRVDLRQPPF